MSDEMNRGVSAVERMLHERVPQTPSPALRARVLAAINEVPPHKAPTATCGIAAPRDPSEYADVVAGTFLMATALSLLIVATLSWTATSQRIGLATDRRLLSFAQRAEAAGITLDVASPSIPHVAGRDARFDDGARPRDILRSIDARSFLQRGL